MKTKDENRNVESVQIEKSKVNSAAADNTQEKNSP